MNNDETKFDDDTDDDVKVSLSTNLEDETLEISSSNSSKQSIFRRAPSP